jgi:hypothetical protein
LSGAGRENATHTAQSGAERADQSTR